MAAMSRGLVPRSRSAKYPKGGTPSSRKHRFESFSQRIAKLKIEPIRRGRSTILDDAELDTTFSYLKNALDEWRDLNTSEVFTSFAKQIAPLCESLPQVLYHNDRILELLVEYIEKGDTWSEEPLLSLMVHFAHDLGVRFEKHFERVVKSISQLAAKHQAIEVIEWSFTCLAWLFKYLSRMIVPDLRPVFDLMSPLLGKEHQKSFVTRFAADSLSFLVRKAGVIYHRDKNPLNLIMRHVSEQLHGAQGSGRDHEFQQGLMSLFAESIKGVQRGLHSSAVSILQEMLLHTYDKEYTTFCTAPLEPVVIGVVTAIIHHTDTETFEPLLDTILSKVKATLADTRLTALSSRLLFVICGARKGSRVKDWKPILELFPSLLDGLTDSANRPPSDLQEFLSLFAVVFQYCSLNSAILHVQLFERLLQDAWENHFLSFCILFADLGAERFQTLLLPYFKSTELCLALSVLGQKEAIPKGSLQLSARWNSLIIGQFTVIHQSSHTAEDSARIAYECNAFLMAADVLNVECSVKDAICRHLFDALKTAVRVTDPKFASPIDILAAGRGFFFLIQERGFLEPIIELWSSFCRVSPIYGQFLLFWRSLLPVLKAKPDVDLTGPYMDSFKNALMQCLGSPSHDLRLAALEIFDIIVANSEELHSIIAVALLIEQTPVSLQNARSISMRIRQLAKNYPAIRSDEWVGAAMPSFCFGLLHMKLAQAWDDSVSALKEMCETKEGEAHISRIALKWLIESEIHPTAIPTHNENNTTVSRRATEYECTNLMYLRERIHQLQSYSDTMEQRLQSTFDNDHSRLTFMTPFSRSQSLRVLDSIPQAAEKHSRQLVPILLDWALDSPGIDISDSAEEVLEQPSHRWARKDQKALLLVFSKFNNPKVLHKASNVYQALLFLLSNGDVEIQKAALKALLTWKDAAITKYQENLFNLLDDARFREEVSLFMDAGEEDSQLQEEHRDRLLPIILRLLYGKVISGRKGQEAKRKAVFIALTRFKADAVHQFLSIAFGPLKNIPILKDGSLNEVIIQKDLSNHRKQLGMLNMLEDILATLKTTVTSFVDSIIDPLLYCLIKASRRLQATPHSSEFEDESASNAQLSLLKMIRQRGFHSLNILFESCPEFAWTPYLPSIVEELVNPRIQQFPIETAQSVSGLLRLFAAWSKSAYTAPYLVQYNRDVLVKICECLAVPSAKDEVKQFVLDNVLRSLISLVSDIEDETAPKIKLLRNRVHSDVLQPYATTILHQISDLLRKSPGKSVLESGVQTVAELAPHIAGSVEARSMIEIATFLLRQPSKRVNPQTKLGLLRILHEFIQRCDSADLDELFIGIFDSICPLFSSFQDQTSRAVLCNILQDLALHHGDLEVVAGLCKDLNSFSTTKLDEPDFDRRSSAYNSITQNSYRSFSLQQWQPLVYNMLYYIKDNEELSIRVNSSLSLRRFIEASAGYESFKPFLSSALIPGIQNGMREKSELVRVEFLAVLSYLVATYADWPPIYDLHVLLSTDEESSFFSNVLHIQGHRRLRALRRLASHASQLQGNTISRILVPLLEHFIFNKAENEAAHNLAGETIRTITALSRSLEWPQFRSLLKRFIRYLNTREDMQKTIIKLLAGLMDGLNQAGRSNGYMSASSEENGAFLQDSEDAIEVGTVLSTLAKTLPQQEKLTPDLAENILPPLTEFLHNKDESTVSLRVPVAIAVTKVLLVLPPREIETRLPPVLLDICYILKSRSQDGRDMARNTLAEISVLTGPKYLEFILKSLNTALQRGYQLHVLSFTLHHILVQMTSTLRPGEINYCLNHVVDIIMDDIFGVTGQEKDAEEYVSNMKEVKSSKSFDSMDIIARFATPDHFVRLILPVKSLLQERLNAKMVQKIDELLRRVGLGILQNPTVKDRDILVFCYELIQEVYKSNSPSDGAAQEDSRNKRYLVNLKGAPKSGMRGSSSSYIYKITRFSLDILRTVLRKHDELRTPQNLTGFLPIMGDALVQGQEEVQISAIRLLTTIIKVPLAALDKNCSAYVTEGVRIIRDAPSTNTEIAQASLKMISAVLRERPNVEIRERDVANLLKRLLPDLDEPDRQGVTFGFIKALMQRKIVITEIYEVMDKVATMMVTNHTRSVRDLARSNYFHFLLEYPQAKNRFTKQLEFLIKNLRYDYVEGRQSVMEALNLILAKVGDNILQGVLTTIFLPIIHSMANDDSSDCRTMAGALLTRLFERADLQRLKSFRSDLRAWLEQDEDTELKRLGIQCWGLYFETTEFKEKEVDFVLERLQSTVEECVQRKDRDNWELIYYALAVSSKLCKLSPHTCFASNKKDFWRAIQSCISYPHTWVKLTAAKLIGMYFADVATTNGDSGLGSLPLEGSHGLQLSEESMIQLTNAFLKNLSVPNVTEELCAQSVRNLAFLARCLAANGAKWNGREVDDDEVEETASRSAITATPTAIHRLIARLSKIIRRETKIMKLSSLFPKSAVMTLLETLSSKLHVEAMLSSLPHLLTTLHTLTDPAITIPRSTDPAFNDTYKAIIEKAREIMNILQKRMGTSEYLGVMQNVQKGVKQRREDRKTKRKIEAITMPEKYGKEKKRRHEVQKARRKEKSAEKRGQRRGW
ncbi:hypothetical protein CC78DRAFT_509265 [Lojkania enalia]|uniref:HEAT repeat protein n=1 Tax=Lojkania enalia TaxID=147567 RepID=A0A9P4N9L5_9PLEO|nr:hypothetical protein CC78DRAFT_509265 [Didymosphaeria enalia]